MRVVDAEGTGNENELLSSESRTVSRRSWYVCEYNFKTDVGLICLLEKEIILKGWMDDRASAVWIERRFE